MYNSLEDHFSHVIDLLKVFFLLLYVFHVLNLLFAILLLHLFNLALPFCFLFDLHLCQFFLR